MPAGRAGAQVRYPVRVQRGVRLFGPGPRLGLGFVLGSVLGTVLGGALFSPAEAARTRTFRADSYEAFRRCEIEGVSLSSEGRVYPGPKVVRLADTGARTLWSLAQVGDQVAFSTGDQGQVFLRDPEGKDGEPKQLASLFDYELFALAGDGEGNLYAAGAPSGTVTRISRDGSTRTLFDMPEGAVYALLPGPGGTVFAATGERGRLYRIESDGNAKVLSESPDLSLRCLAWSADRKFIWAGTDGRGLVEQISPESGDTRVVYDASEEEIVAILPLPDGGLYFGANPGPQGAQAVGGSGGSGGAGGGGRDAAAAGAGPRDAVVVGSPDEPKPTVYRMTPNGSVQVLWQAPERMIHALALDADGEVLVATGDEAAIYRISPSGRETLLYRAEEEQVLALKVLGRSIFAGTGSPGRLYRLGPEPSEAGTITSRVLNARDQSKWGALQWDGVAEQGKITFETRSGFTDPPDASWTEWVSVRDAGDGAYVVSPPARYLQWRARLESRGMESGGSADPAGGPYLRRLQIAYAGGNDRPRLTSVRVSPDEPVFTNQDGNRGGLTQVLPGGIQIDYSLPPSGSSIVAVEEVPTWIRRIRSIVWEAQEPDGDDLEYKLEIRKLGESEFRTLAADVRDRGWSLDSATLPDGVYEIRVTASDAPSNAPGEQLTDERLTPPFHIDTVAPVFSDVQARRVSGADRDVIEIEGRATDESSPLRRVDVAVDGQEFRWLSATDGLMDSRSELFHGQVPVPVGKEANWVVVRAQDEAGNRGTHRAWLVVAGKLENPEPKR